MANKHIKGADLLKAKLNKVSRESSNELERVLVDMASTIDDYSKRKIQGGSRSGKEYKRRSVTHRASSPGEFPKTDTGSLINSIRFDRLSKLNYTVGSHKNQGPHGKWLEYGTRNMKPRPWLLPSFKYADKKIKSEYKTLLKRLVREFS